MILALQSDATADHGDLLRSRLNAIIDMRHPLVAPAHPRSIPTRCCASRWVENPYYQFFCSEEFFQHKLVLDRSSLTRC
jgi:hypothetical protein